MAMIHYLFFKPTISLTETNVSRKQIALRYSNHNYNHVLINTQILSALHSCQVWESENQDMLGVSVEIFDHAPFEITLINFCYN